MIRRIFHVAFALAIAVALSNLACHKYDMKSRSASSAPTSNMSNSSNNAAAPSDEAKYKLYYAAAKTNDKAIELEVGQKIGITDAAGHPTEYSQKFLDGYKDWMMKDERFTRKYNTPESAREYVDKHK